MRRLTRAGCPAAFVQVAETELARARLYFENTGKSDGFKFDAYRHADVKTALSRITGVR